MSPSATTSIILNATDTEKDTLTYTASTLNTPKGTLVKTSEGKYTYTLKAPLPTASFKETFTYTAFDGKLTSAPATVTINYTLVPPTKFTLTVSKVGNGTITASGISCGGTCQGDFTKDTTAAVTATPDAGYTFTGWTGACTGMVCSVTMNTAKTVTATFTKTNTAPTVKPITVTVGGSGQAVITPDGTDMERDTLIYTPNKTILTYGTIIKLPDGTFRYTLTNKATNGVTDTFTYTASDGKLTSSPATVTINIPKIVVLDTDLDSVIDANDLCPNTPATLRLKVDTYGCPRPKITTFDIRPSSSTSLKNIVNAVLGRGSIGQIQFNQPVDLVRDNAELDVDSNILITAKRVEVRAANVPELNKPATITLYGITEKNPKILRNGVECPPTVCVIQSFEQGVLTFTVSGF